MSLCYTLKNIDMFSSFLHLINPLTYLKIIIVKIKGESYNIDSSIPLCYLLSFMLDKFIALTWGMIRFRTLKTVFVSPSAKILCSSKIKFGKALVIGRNVYIDALSNGGLHLGNNVSMGYATYISLTGSLKHLGTQMIIGDNVGLGSHGFYGCGLGGVKIGDNSIFGNYVSIHPETHIFSDTELPIREQGCFAKGGVTIGNDCWIGAKVTILDGTIIGDHSIVAAGAVVTGKFPPYSIIGGVPAKVIKMRK